MILSLCVSFNFSFSRTGLHIIFSGPFTDELDLNIPHRACTFGQAYHIAGEVNDFDGFTHVSLKYLTAFGHDRRFQYQLTCLRNGAGNGSYRMVTVTRSRLAILLLNKGNKQAVRSVRFPKRVLRTRWK